jgi:hypothetical protein
VGFKSVMITNTFSLAPSEISLQDSCLDSSEIESYLKHKPHAYYLWVVFHELFGHGTGKMLVQTGPESFNFNNSNPPLNPLTGQPISSWYHVGETWTGLFGDIATSVDECRAECVGAYLMSDKDLLGIFGFLDSSDITSDDCTHCLSDSISIILTTSSGVQYVRTTWNCWTTRVGKFQCRKSCKQPEFVSQAMIACRNNALFLSILNQNCSIAFGLTFGRNGVKLIAGYDRNPFSESNI